MILHLNCIPAADKVELKHGRVKGMQLLMRRRSRSASVHALQHQFDPICQLTFMNYSRATCP